MWDQMSIPLMEGSNSRIDSLEWWTRPQNQQVFIFWKYYLDLELVGHPIYRNNLLGTQWFLYETPI
jgi:hypothetical protein